MRDAQGCYAKGSSGNPTGRPKKTVATYMKTMLGVKGKRGVAKLIIQAVLEGKITFPDGQEMRLDTKEWKGFVELLLDRLDGKPVQPVQVEQIAQVELTAEDFAEAEERMKRWEAEKNGPIVTSLPATSSTIM